MGLATQSPRLGTYRDQDRSPAASNLSLARTPSIPRLNTSLSNNSAITPISTRSPPSAMPSPSINSLQSSPVVAHGLLIGSQLSGLTPFELPESIVSSSSAFSSAKDIPAIAKSGNLIRKLSQSAKDGVSSTRQVIRRKASSSAQSRRDESTGPVFRRRSDSRTTAPNSLPADPSALEAFPSELSTSLSYFADNLSVLNDSTSLKDASPEGQAPSVPELLVRGCILQKISKKKKQERVFFLNPYGTRISWKDNVRTKSFHIDNIKSIRAGEEAANTQQELRGERTDPERCFTINYVATDSSTRLKTLHLVARSKEELCLWVDTLNALAKHREELMTSMVGYTEWESVIRNHWDNEVGKHSSKENRVEGLDLNAIHNLCRKLHIHCPAYLIDESFRQADPTQSRSLDFDRFKQFIRFLRERRDIRRVYHSLCDSHTSGISRARFMTFLEDTQGIDLSSPATQAVWRDKVNALIDSSFPERISPMTNDNIDFESFVGFLLSKNCHIYSTPLKPVPNFDNPLNDYFISSSHNTYLLGWQVGGTSSAEPYITAIRHGCRCVEIDCWDGPDGQPRVTHGHTKTSAIPFADCIHAINNCAFDVSPYPLIVSLEVHCCPDQQRKMVMIMMELLGEKLLLHPISETGLRLPSPEDLKHKILIKVKATNVHADLAAYSEHTIDGRFGSCSSPTRRPVGTSNNSLPALTMLPSPSITSPSETLYSPTDQSATATSASSGEDSDAPPPSPLMTAINTPHKPSKVIPVLSNLGVYLQGHSLRDSRDLTFQKFNHIYSLNETKAIELSYTPENKALFEDHNRSYLCRVYPKNTRWQSSNFDPNTFWRRGVQMVALNWQTYDAHLQMNQAMFAAGTDSYGYVLKPDYLRNPRNRVGTIEHRVKLPRFTVAFSVQVISAQQLPRPGNSGRYDSLNPFIEVQMFSAEDKARGIAYGSGGEELSANNGYHGIGSPYRRRTRPVPGNGYNPQFNETIELSLDTKYPELVFVRFIVYNSPDPRLAAGKNCKQLAVFTAKLVSLQQGYRHIPLYNGHGEEFIFSSLFCQIKKQAPRLSSSSLKDIGERPSRPGLLRGMLSRGLSGDRGRDRASSLDEQRAPRYV